MTNPTHGLKDHEIAAVINAVTTHLNARIYTLPQCLRELVSDAVVQTLENRNLRIDARKEPTISETDRAILAGLINLFREEDSQGRFRVVLQYDNYQDGAQILDGDEKLIGECYYLFDNPPGATDAEHSILLQFKVAIIKAMQNKDKER